MRKYKVLINGQNFLINVNGRDAKHGFLTMRFVEANDPSAAENAAVEKVRETQQVRDLVKNEPDDPPIMYVADINELESFDHIANREPGLAWYPEKPNHWWQFWRP